MGENSACKRAGAGSLKHGKGRLRRTRAPFPRNVRGAAGLLAVAAAFIILSSFFASAALSNLNFSTGNISISNSPWYYPGHEYRKQIIVNGSSSNLSGYQIPINLTTAIYNNTGLVGSWHFTNNDTSDFSGNGNNGVQNGGVNCTVAGKFGTGCGFDGTAEF